MWSTKTSKDKLGQIFMSSLKKLQLRVQGRDRVKVCRNVGDTAGAVSSTSPHTQQSGSCGFPKWDLYVYVPYLRPDSGTWGAASTLCQK